MGYANYANYKAGWLISMLAILLWLVVTALGIFAPQHSLAGLHWYLVTVALALFSLGHASRRYGWRTTAGLFLIAVIISNLTENLSLSTGVPFGSYIHQPSMGPKLFLVPVILGPIYFGIIFIAWTLAEMILGPERKANAFRFGMPVVTAFIVTGFDLCVDPISATIARDWVFFTGGGYYGTPLSNYVGWFVNGWLVAQCFAFYLDRVRTYPTLPAAYWYEAPALWSMMALQFPLILWLSGESVVVHDPGGWAWRSGDILQNAAIISVYTMLMAAVTAWFTVRLRRERH